MDDATAGYDLIEPFNVDDGSLLGLSPAVCFALGAEWEAFRKKLTVGAPFTDLVMSHNARRLSAMAERHCRFAEHHSHCDGWSVIVVGGHFV